MAMNLTFLYNTKIQNRLLIAFGIAIMLFGVFAGYALYQVRYMKDILEKLHEHPMTVSNCSLKASESVIKMHRGMILYTSTTDSLERQQALKNVLDLEEDVYENLDYVKKQILGAEGAALEAEVRFLFLQLQDVREEIVAAVEKGNLEEARTLTVMKESNQINELESKFNKLKDHALHRAEFFIEDAQHSQTRSQMTMFTMLVVIIAIIVIIAILTSQSILSPLKYIKGLLRRLGRGEQPDEIQAQGKDEIAEMVLTVNNLVKGLKKTAAFATEIGENHLDTEFKVLSEKDVLGNSLIEMRQRLVEFADEEKKRQWSIEGIAKFADILRNNQANIEVLADTVVAELIKYINANQGAIFLLKNEDDAIVEETNSLDLVASYAWGKKKYIKKNILIGEGLVGQCAQEQDTLYFTDVPDNFIKIRSGLGEASPRCILIVPLKFNEELLGVVELASFRVLEEFEVEFVEQLAENIAATISILQINQRTVHLLRSAQEDKEYSKEQEEKLREQTKDAIARQEDMERFSNEQHEKILSLEKEIEQLKLAK
ncbi:MAG: GAF domain-containing protein [Cytophagales bacterium]|nr:GAF domain-containing protein [Cytophagales bacterium]